MARLNVLFFFLGSLAAWWNDNASRLDCLESGQPIGSWSRRQYQVPTNLVVTREEVSGRGVGPRLDFATAGATTEDVSGRDSPVRRTLLQRRLNSVLPLPNTPQGIQERWPCTYRLDCSELGRALGPVTRSGRSWRPYLRAMKQNNCTCTIQASTMCVEGMHRKVYETFHGPNTFLLDAWMAAKNWTAKLLRVCKKENIWEERKGAVEDDVLDMIQKMGGVRTASGQGHQEVMRLKYEKHTGDKLTPERVAKLLDQGPCIVRLFVGPWWGCFDATKNDNWVYRGTGRDEAAREDCKWKYPDEKDIIGSHTVVCFDYETFENGEMRVRVLDNHTDAGPERWVDLKELDAIYSLKVDCLCGEDEHLHDAGDSGTI